MLELVYAIGIRYNGIVFVGRNLTLRNVKHPLPSLNNLPLFNHAGDIAIAGINHLTGLFVVLGLADAWLRNRVRIAFVC